MSNEIKRATGLLVIEAVNSNPNGDPGRESEPRQRPTGIGEISPVSFKRKLRDLLGDKDSAFYTKACRKGSPKIRSAMRFWNHAGETKRRIQRIDRRTESL